MPGTMSRFRERIPGPRYLIVNADDFGLSDSVTQGIIKAWQDGIETSTTALTNIAGAVARVREAHTQHPDLPIGVHLNITTGQPVLPPSRVASLVDAYGQFYPLEAILQRLACMDVAEVRAELAAQACVLLDAGVQFDHIDYHQQVLTFYSPFFAIVCELALMYRVPVRLPVPEWVYGVIRQRGSVNTWSVLGYLLRFVVRHPLLARRILPQMHIGAFKQRATGLHRQGIATTNWFVGSFFGDVSVETLSAILAQLPPGVSELMVHPGLPVTEQEGVEDEYSSMRGRELAVLTDSRLPAILREHSIKCVDFSFVQQ